MAAVRIIVSALGDNSLPTAFDPFIVSAKKAQAQVRREMQGTSAIAKREAERGAAAAARANEQIARSFQKREQEQVRIAERAAQQREKAVAREFMTRMRESAKARVAEERDIMRTAATREREEKRANRVVLSATRDTVQRVGHAIGGLVKTGASIGANGLRGMGLDLDFGSLIGKSVNLSALATKVTNSGMMAKGKNATLDDVRATEAAIKAAGSATAQDYGAMAGALDQFVGATGDLEGGKKALVDLGKIANATGTPVEQLGLLAGKLSKDMGDVPNKADRVSEALRNLALQGMLGNVELEDLAKFGGRISANAFMFAGDRNKVISELGAMAQISMQGGRVDAAEATNSVARFSSQMGNENVQDNIKKQLGSDFQFYTDSSKKTMRGPADLVTDIVSRAGGDQDKVAGAFKNVMSKSVVQGFTKIFNDAGGGEKGKQAVRDTFAKFTKPLSKDSVENANKLVMEGDAAKVTKANQELAEAAMALVPALREMLPAVTSAAKWISQNLGTAITAAVVGSIAKAALGDALKNAFLGGGGGGGGAAPGGGTIAANGLSVVAAGAVAFTATTVLLDAIDKAEVKNSNLIAADEQDMFKTMVRVQGGDRDALKLLDEQIERGDVTLNDRYARDRLHNPEGFRKNLDEAKRVRLEARQRQVGDSMDEAIYRPQMSRFMSDELSKRDRDEMSGGEVIGAMKAGGGPSGGSGGSGGGAAEMKGAADAHVQAANAIQSAIGQMVAAVTAAASKGGGSGPGVDPSGRH